MPEPTDKAERTRAVKRTASARSTDEAGAVESPASAKAAAAPSDAAPSDAGRLPAVYLGHGAPILIDDPIWPGELAGWAAKM